LANQLRQALEKLRHYYINKLVNAGIYQATDVRLQSLTITELESIVKKSSPQKNNPSKLL
jgi:hypothetical protein